MSRDRSLRSSVLVLIAITASLFAMSACRVTNILPAPTPAPATATPAPATATPEPFRQRFMREQVAKTISRVALEYGCWVDPSDIDVIGIMEPSLWPGFITWVGAWLLTDADMRGALKSTILDWDMSLREFVDQLPGCDQ